MIISDSCQLVVVIERLHTELENGRVDPPKIPRVEECFQTDLYRILAAPVYIYRVQSCLVVSGSQNSIYLAGVAFLICFLMSRNVSITYDQS